MTGVHYVTNTSLSLAEWPQHLTTATNGVAVSTTCFCTKRQIMLHTVCMIQKKSKYHVENLARFSKKRKSCNSIKLWCSQANILQKQLSELKIYIHVQQFNNVSMSMIRFHHFHSIPETKSRHREPSENATHQVNTWLASDTCSQKEDFDHNRHPLNR